GCSDVKQYSGDVFVTVALLAAAAAAMAQWRTSRRVDRWGIVTLVATAVVAPWLSFPSVFMLGGLSLAVLPACVRRGLRGWLTWLAVNAIVLASFAPLYLAILRHRSDTALLSYWHDSFPPPAHQVAWTAREIYRTCAYAVD